MANKPIIRTGHAGVDMLINPFLLDGVRKYHFAKNFEFSEGVLKTRPSIRSTNSGVNGDLKGTHYHTPRHGLLAVPKTNSPTAIVIATDSTYLVPITECNEFLAAEQTINSPSYTGDVNFTTSENYLISFGEGGNTAWLSRGLEFECSKGISKDYCSTDGYETFDNDKHNNWLPNEGIMGHFAHARTFVSVDSNAEGFCSFTSMILASDIAEKRGCLFNDDLLKMEEEVAYGTPLVAPSKFGRTVAIETLPDNVLNGEGNIVDFREGGVLYHNPILPRETQREPNDSGQLVVTQEGWDKKRLSQVVLQTVSAVGRYAVAQLPNDLLFRSVFGLHLLRRTLGQGSLNDESTNHISQDVQPLMDLDCPEELKQSTVGHWLHGSRFMATVGGNKGFVVMNQTQTFTEDRTPRAVWEGLWTPTQSIEKIHRFLPMSYRPNQDRYGFVSSDAVGDIYLSEFDETIERGMDLVDGNEELVEQVLITGNYVMSGFNVLSKLQNAFLEIITNATSEELTVFVLTDKLKEWKMWKSVELTKSSQCLIELGAPEKTSEEGTWFRFKFVVKGYVEVLNFDVQYAQLRAKTGGQGGCTPCAPIKEDYFA